MRSVACLIFIIRFTRSYQFYLPAYQRHRAALPARQFINKPTMFLIPGFKKPGHVTFTLPGPVTRALFEKRFPCEDLITTTAGVYWKELLKSAGNPGNGWQSGSIATLHKCGNALNYNPHVHLIGTRELVNTLTGEILRSPLLNYRRIRFSWMNAVLRLFRKYGMLTEEEVRIIREKYINGFHVHLQPVIGTTNEVLFRTAEYLAAGYFHNSMITGIDHNKAKITFRYKSWVDRNTKEKTYSEMTMDIYDFIARMLFYLPEIAEAWMPKSRHAAGCREKRREKTHLLHAGYFRMKKGP